MPCDFNSFFIFGPIGIFFCRCYLLIGGVNKSPTTFGASN